VLALPHLESCLQVRQVSFLIFYFFISFIEFFFLGPDSHVRDAGRQNGSVQVRRRHQTKEREGSQRGRRRRERRRKRNGVTVRNRKGGWMMEEGINWEKFIVYRVMRVDSRIKVVKWDLVELRICRRKQQGVLRGCRKS
jgi:hypothetical protein